MLGRARDRSVGRIASCASCAFLALVCILARRLGHVGACHNPRRSRWRAWHDRRTVDLHAVGSHIGDETGGLAADIDAFIEPLRDAHGVRGREAELAAGFLLQGRGGEGRLRVALRRLGFDGCDREAGGLDRLLEILGFRAGADVEALDLLAVGADQPRLERLAARRRQSRDQRPIFARTRISRSRVRGRRPAAAPPTAPGRPSARPAVCATTPAKG